MNTSYTLNWPKQPYYRVVELELKALITGQQKLYSWNSNKVELPTTPKINTFDQKEKKKKKHTHI